MYTCYGSQDTANPAALPPFALAQVRLMWDSTRVPPLPMGACAWSSSCVQQGYDSCGKSVVLYTRKNCGRDLIVAIAGGGALLSSHSFGIVLPLVLLQGVC